MRLTTRHLTAAAALVALVPFTSACTVTFGAGGSDSSAAPSSAAPSSPAASPTQDAAASPSATPAPATSSPAEAATPTASAPTSAPASDAPGSGHRRTIDVAPGHGIQKMELIDLYAADATGGSYGRAVGVFDVTTDRPLLINLRVQLFDAAGKEIATNDGLNPSYTVGRHHLVTSNLVRLPVGARPTTFKVTLVDTTDMHSPTFTTFERPRIGTKNGVSALVGGFGFTGRKDRTLEAQGACVMPDGKIYEGQDGLTDNPSSDAGGKTSGTYEIPLYDARRGVDLSKATCYASV